MWVKFMKKPRPKLQKQIAENKTDRITELYKDVAGDHFARFREEGYFNGILLIKLMIKKYNSSKGFGNSRIISVSIGLMLISQLSHIFFRYYVGASLFGENWIEFALHMLILLNGSFSIFMFY